MFKKFISAGLLLVALSFVSLEARSRDNSTPNCSVGHPLDPLSCEEITAIKTVVDALDIRQNQNFFYVDIVLKEPKKSAVKKFEKDGGAFVREGRAILYNNATAETWEITVAVCGSVASVRKEKKLCGVIPNMNRINDFTGTPTCGGDTHFTGDELAALLIGSEEVLDALRQAGYKNPETLIPDTLLPVVNTFESFRSPEKSLPCCPEVITKDLPRNRYVPVTFSDLNIRDPFAGDFFSIVNGVEVVVDVTDKKIIAVIVTNPTRVKKFEDDPIPLYEHINCLKPLTSDMPEGPSFCIENNVVTWDNWTFRLAWDTRSGLHLFNIKYWDSTKEEDDKYRSILYKAHLSDAVVTYNVGSEILFARNYLSGDAFHYPWLRRHTSICLGRDVPTYATLLNMYAADTNGNPITFENSVAIYEQDADILWRSASPILDTDIVEGARGRQLVVRTIFQGLYYLWIVSWIFNQDGTINVGIDVGGRTQNIIIPAGSELPWGELIAKQEFALNHTHVYNFRLDFDIDGVKNSIVEENQFTINDLKRNPCGQATDVCHKVLKTEKKAIRDMNLESNRQWIVTNPNKKNRLGHPVGYELLPLKNGFEKSADYSTLHQQFSFVKHHLHVTRFHDNEQFAAGEMPILQDRDTGLGEFVKDDESIENQDIVAWYTINFSHVPHAEDYPFITLYRQGFALVPHNFFGSNPAITVVNPDVVCDEPLSNPECNLCIPQPALPPCPIACD